MTDVAETAVQTGEVAAEDQARAQVYALLATMLAQPLGEELLAALQQLDAPAPEKGSDMSDAWGALKQEDTRETAQDVEEE